MTAIISSLPPGFRFHPTDEELIHCLKNTVSSSLSPQASIIAEVHLYELNPWELPDKAYFGDSEWFCFSPRNRKYPKDARPNRTAASGYWKATGTDKPILSSHASQYLGVKKTLTFYQGRAPKGTKTNWMMNEYRLPNNSPLSLSLQGSMRVLCRVRHKGNISELKKQNGTNSFGDIYSYYLEGCDDDIAKYVNQNSEKHKSSSHEIIEVVDAKDDEDLTERTREGQVSDGNLEFKENRRRSLKDALETIKRVLSLGALDEQVPEWPNKRSCSLTASDCRGNSTIFEIPSI